MTHVNPSQKAFEKIMKGEIRQKPRWFFVIKNIFLWIFGVLSMLAGALFMSVIIFTAVNSDMDLHREIYGYAISCMTICTIIAWLVLLGIFVILCDVSVRHTKRGYVYPISLIITLHVGVSMILGMLLYVSGIGCYVDDVLGAHMRFYYDVEKRRGEAFHVPDKGFVMGRIVRYDNQTVELVSPHGDLWMIAVANLPAKKQDHLRNSEYAVFLGVIDNKNIFIACDVKMRGLQGVRFERQMQEQQYAITAQYMQQHARMTEILDNLRSGSMNPCNNIIHWRMHP